MRRRKIVAAEAALVVLLAIVITAAAALGRHAAPAPTVPTVVPQPPQPPVKCGGVASKVPDITVARWLVHAVERKQPQLAWGLASAEFRHGTTCADWRHGSLPADVEKITSVTHVAFDGDTLVALDDIVVVDLLLTDAAGRVHRVHLDMHRNRAGVWLIESWQPAGRAA